MPLETQRINNDNAFAFPISEINNENIGSYFKESTGMDNVDDE